mmetsp:Transcript_17492/g.39492  ORF Transcript_17492/g.39492 Transcript_17492/m.39492 type:complete len:99 (+) Transcript_17492:774-1070(+)
MLRSRNTKEMSVGNGDVDDKNKQRNALNFVISFCSSMKLVVLITLCLQNSMFTVLRRYSQGVLNEKYSSHEVLMVGELIKILYCEKNIHGQNGERCVS